MVDTLGINSRNSINLNTNRRSRGSDHTKVTRDRTDRGDSKISNRITKSFLENEKSFLKNPNDYEKIVEETHSDFNESLIKETEGKETIVKEPIRVNLEIPDGTIKSINLRITNAVTMSDLLKQSIDLFNDMFASQRLPYLLRSDSTEYCFKPSKKSGKADYDLPKINLSNKVFETNLKFFTIIYNKKDLMEKKEKKFVCRNCLIW